MLTDAPSSVLAFYTAIYEAADSVDGASNPLLAPSELSPGYAEAVCAYVWGLPLTSFWETQGQFVTDPAFAPINQMYLAPSIDTSTAIVTPNTSVLYAQAWLDLHQTPFVVTYPDVDGVYNVLQVMDAYTNVQGSVGTRVDTGGEVVIYWTGASYADEVQALYSNTIAIDTPQAWILGRIAVDAYAIPQEDGVAQTPYQETETGSAASPLALWHVQELLQGYTLAPVPGIEPGTDPLQPSSVTISFQDIYDGNQANLDVAATAYFTHLAQAVNVNGLLVNYSGVVNGELGPEPTLYDQTGLFERFRLIGLTAEGYDPPADLKDAIEAGFEAAMTVVDMLALSSQPSSDDNYWSINTSLGQYEPSHKGWILGAVVADIGLGANLATDGTYPQTSVDANGQQLNGANQYKIDFGTDLPPVEDGFWSVTVYAQATEAIVPSTGNTYYYTSEIGGVYALGSIQFAADAGPITLYLQSDAPSDGALHPYWLPVPDGEDFYLVMRLYNPTPANTEGLPSVLNPPDGASPRWVPPPVELVETEVDAPEPPVTGPCSKPNHGEQVREWAFERGLKGHSPAPGDGTGRPVTPHGLEPFNGEQVREWAFGRGLKGHSPASGDGTGGVDGLPVGPSVNAGSARSQARSNR